MIRWNGITAKLLLAFFAVLVISFASTSLFSSWFVRTELNDRNVRFEKDQLEVAAALVRSSYRENWDPGMMRSALRMASGPMNRTLFVLDRQGRILLQTGFQSDQELAEEDKNAALEALGQGSPFLDVPSQAESRSRLSATLINGTEDMDAAYLVIRTTVEPRPLFFFNGTFRSVMITAFVVGFIIVAIVSGRLSSRIRKMSEAARMIAKGRFDIRLQTKPKDELGELADSLNHMSEELASLDKMRREFLANVSHDLRSPLTSISGYAEAMIDGAIPPERSGVYLGLIREQTRRMNRLVNDLLEVARMEAGRMEIHPADYNITEWIRRLLAALDPDFARRNLSFELIGDQEDVWVRADPHRIDQVLSNLLLNAIQFSPNGKSVEVSIKRKGQTAVIGVHDHGVGIAEANLGKVWQRFYKSDKARSAHSGSGLGLSIVQHVLEKHGTHATVASRLGEGTSFWFELPTVEPPSTARSNISREMLSE
ncbi:sensor histidine kinase [Cohnella thailandensis]|uniref:histidine kinase n=1 Tax=Cohnella thailandensis TaxID=557557 RepID=A0A841SPT3_9BACL|nr:HAMP domain-containing sensor histidine kinase [Cohnella thailandensis]MBB6633964.1 HAMP domain-containing protein [Cohnella thailandensis]MBP1972647.1 signal transduction histidine kinase [Cohnella thailandensis]